MTKIIESFDVIKTNAIPSNIIMAISPFDDRRDFNNQEDLIQQLLVKNRISIIELL